MPTHHIVFLLVVLAVCGYCFSYLFDVTNYFWLYLAGAICGTAWLLFLIQ